MPQPTDLDLAAILTPLPGDSTVGANLRADSSFQSPLRNLRDKARDARTKERDARDGKGSELNPALAGLADWQAIRKDAWSILAGTSKDVDVASLLIEALARTDGMGGLAFGFQACSALIAEFWDGILQRAQLPLDADEGSEPLSVEDAIESQLRLLGQLNENDLLVLPIGYAVITGGGLAYWQYQQAVEAEKKTPEERERTRIATLAEFQKSAAATDAPFYEQLVENLSGARGAILELERVLAEKLGEYASYAPSFTNVLSAIDNVDSSIRHLAKDKLRPREGAAGIGGGPSPGGVSRGGGEGAGFGEGTPASRDQAFQQLLAIADFFSHTEPLSLLAEQIRQVVHRGRLRPEEYYAELIESDEVLQRFFKTVGIRSRAPEASSEGEPT